MCWTHGINYSYSVNYEDIINRDDTFAKLNIKDDNEIMSQCLIKEDNIKDKNTNNAQNISIYMTLTIAKLTHYILCNNAFYKCTFAN